jgi:hypothetical protein
MISLETFESQEDPKGEKDALSLLHRCDLARAKTRIPPAMYSEISDVEIPD